MCAYNFWCAGTDWATSGRPRVRPGDTILVHAGIYKYNRYEYTNDATVNRTVPLDGTYYLTADGTPDMPIAIKAAGDGEVDLRRRRQLRALRRARRRLQLLRGHHVQERRDRDPGGHAVHCRLEGTDGEALPLRERRRGRVHQLLRLEQLLHRRQHVHRPQRSEASDRLERRVLEQVQRRRGADLSADDGVLRGREALRPRPRRRLQLHRRLPRRHQHRDLRQSRTAHTPAARASSTARSIRRASTGIAGRWRSTSTTTTSPTRTTTRSRPTAACTTSASCGTC